MPDKFALDFSPGYLLVLAGLFLFAFALVWFLRTWIRSPRTGAAWMPGVVTVVLLVAVAGYAVFTSALGQLFSTFSLWFLLGSVAFSFLLQTFRRTVGGLAVLLFALLVVFVILFLRGLTAFTGAVKIADVRVLSADAAGMQLQVDPAATAQPEKSTVYTLKGAQFGCIVYTVVFDDVAVFVGARTRYAWLGLTAFDAGLKQTDLALFPDFMDRNAVFGRMERAELRLPFVKSVQKTIAVKNAVSGMRYELKMGNTGALLLEPVK